MATFLLELVTPERILLSEQVSSVRAPGIDGSFGILTGHAPLMTALGVGLVKVEYPNGDLEYIATSGGFIEVNREKTIILSDTAERAADIDATRAEGAIERAKEHLTDGSAENYGEARAALERATNRLKVIQMSKER